MSDKGTPAATSGSRDPLAEVSLPDQATAVSSSRWLSYTMIPRLLPRLARLLALAPIVLAACTGNGSGGGSGAEAGAPDLGRCQQAERYLIDQLGMVTETGPDTLDDWRTDRMLPACRVTAAGSTPLPIRDVAEGLYAGLFATGWVRSPDPQDAPAESSLRLRQGESECLFSLYDNIALGTPEELRVMNALVIPPGEKRYNVLAQCTPPMESAG